MSTFDGGLIVGDIVLSSYKNRGFWRIVEIQERFYGTPPIQYASDIHVELVMSLDGLVPKKKARKMILPAYTLSKVNEEKIEEWRIHDENKWKTLSDIVRVKSEKEIMEEMIEEGKIIPDPEILSFFGPPISLSKEKENGISNASQISH